MKDCAFLFLVKNDICEAFLCCDVMRKNAKNPAPDKTWHQEDAGILWKTPAGCS
jgi:hypothetical protein